MKNYVTRISNNHTIDINKLSIQELYMLHYEEECHIASFARKLSPFSNERNTLLSNGYELINKISTIRHVKEFGFEKDTFGVSLKSINILLKLIIKKNKNNKNKTKLLLYEAGVGTGFAIKQVLNHCTMDLDIMGCDFYLNNSVIELSKRYSNVVLEQGSIYDCIKKLPYNSIDIFYADNVFEHFLPDEATIIYDEIIKRLKNNAILFLIIPNKYLGPSDISSRFLSFGEKAQGFHFMEMSFNEVTNKLEKYDVVHQYCVLNLFKLKTIFIKSKFLINVKLKLERIVARIPIRLIKRGLFCCLRYDMYIMRKL